MGYDLKKDPDAYLGMNESYNFIQPGCSIKKTFNISCAHKLLPGSAFTEKCTHVHGHNYKITLELYSHKLNGGMVLDYGKIKCIFENKIKNVFDHKLILHVDDATFFDENTAYVDFNPTAENLARYIMMVLYVHFKTYHDIQLKSVTVSETDSTSATAYSDA